MSTISGYWYITYGWYWKLSVFVTAPVSIRIRIRCSLSLGFKRSKLIEGRELLMLIGTGFLGKDENLVTRAKLVWTRDLLLLAEVLDWLTFSFDTLLSVRVRMTLTSTVTSEGLVRGEGLLFRFLVEGIYAQRLYQNMFLLHDCPYCNKTQIGG